MAGPVQGLQALARRPLHVLACHNMSEFLSVLHIGIVATAGVDVLCSGACTVCLGLGLERK